MKKVTIADKAEAWGRLDGSLASFLQNVEGVYQSHKINFFASLGSVCLSEDQIVLKRYWGSLISEERI
jgi:hypothetical protein